MMSTEKYFKTQTIFEDKQDVQIINNELGKDITKNGQDSFPDIYQEG